MCPATLDMGIRGPIGSVGQFPTSRQNRDRIQMERSKKAISHMVDSKDRLIKLIKSEQDRIKRDQHIQDVASTWYKASDIHPNVSVVKVRYSDKEALIKAQRSAEIKREKNFQPIPYYQDDNGGVSPNNTDIFPLATDDIRWKHIMKADRRFSRAFCRGYDPKSLAELLSKEKQGNARRKKPKHRPSTGSKDSSILSKAGITRPECDENFYPQLQEGRESFLLLKYKSDDFIASINRVMTGKKLELVRRPSAAESNPIISKKLSYLPPMISPALSQVSSKRVRDIDMRIHRDLKENISLMSCSSESVFKTPEKQDSVTTFPDIDSKHNILENKRELKVNDVDRPMSDINTFRPMLSRERIASAASNVNWPVTSDDSRDSDINSGYPSLRRRRSSFYEFKPCFPVSKENCRPSLKGSLINTKPDKSDSVGSLPRQPSDDKMSLDTSDLTVTAMKPEPHTKINQDDNNKEAACLENDKKDTTQQKKKMNKKAKKKKMNNAKGEVSLLCDGERELEQKLPIDPVSKQRILQEFLESRDWSADELRIKKDIQDMIFLCELEIEGAIADTSCGESLKTEDDHKDDNKSTNITTTTTTTTTTKPHLTMSSNTCKNQNKYLANITEEELNEFINDISDKCKSKHRVLKEFSPLELLKTRFLRLHPEVIKTIKLSTKTEGEQDQDTSTESFDTNYLTIVKRFAVQSEQ